MPHLVYATGNEPGFGSLRGASTRIIAARDELQGTFAYRAAQAVAERLNCMHLHCSARIRQGPLVLATRLTTH